MLVKLLTKVYHKSASNDDDDYGPSFLIGIISP